MTIESDQDAKDYLKKIQRGLWDLHELSKEAGLNTHAAMFIAISAAFAHSAEKISCMVGAVMVQNELSMEEYKDEMFGEE